MKTIALCALILSLGSFAQAGQEGYGAGKPMSNAQLIYLALNVQPVSKTYHDGIWYKEKSVGQLTCLEIHRRSSYATKYSCDIDSTGFQDNEAIYRALNVKPVAINPGIAGSGAMKKSVGNLICTSRQVIYPHAPVNYECVLN